MPDTRHIRAVAGRVKAEVRLDAETGVPLEVRLDADDLVFNNGLEIDLLEIDLLEIDWLEVRPPHS